MKKSFSNFFKIALCGYSLVLVAATSYAEVIEFQDEDLNTETVLPVFDQKVAVRNRNIQLTGKFEVGAFAGVSLNEAFYQPGLYGFNLGYHLDEVHGVSFQYMNWQGGLSSYGKQLKNPNAGTIDEPFDASKAPHAERLYLLNWQWAAYYGKISLTKQTVMNLSGYTLLGLGQINFGGTDFMAVNAGIGQKLYFSKNWALRMDLNFIYYTGPDPTSESLRETDPIKGVGDFDTKDYFNQTISIGIIGQI